MNKTRVALVSSIPVLVFSLVLAVASSARAAHITVTSVADDLNLGPNGNCTLREAILAANTNAAVDACPAGSPGADTITLLPGTYRLTITGAGEDAGATGDLDVTEDVSIEALPGSVTIDASALGDRVLDIAAGATVSLANLTLTGGHVTGAPGETVSGGGIRNAGTLTLTSCVVTGNTAHAADSLSLPVTGGSALGGGIASTGSLTLASSHVTANTATAGAGGSFCLSPLTCGVSPGGNATGGGVESAGALTVTGSEISGNSATGGAGAGAGFSGTAPGGGASGGGIDAQSTLGISTSTISGNTATGGPSGAPLLVTAANGGTALGGGLHAAGVTTLDTSLIAGNTAHGGGGATPGGTGGVARGAGARSESSFAATNSTITGNAAVGGTAGNGVAGFTLAAGTGGTASGAGIDGTGTLAIKLVTLASNVATGGTGGNGDTGQAGGVGGAASGGGLDSTAAAPQLANGIVAANAAVGGPGGSGSPQGADGAASGSGCGSVTGGSTGGNVESPDDTCGLDQSGDLAAATASAVALSPLAANGGPTQTQAIAATSVAVGRGLAAACTSTDQRGFLRGAPPCDSGAYEYGATFGCGRVARGIDGAADSSSIALTLVVLLALRSARSPSPQGRKR